MLSPKKVIIMAGAKEKENLRFRSFLKNHADETELDRQFAALHDELFSSYDCSKCRNCCRLISPCFHEWDIPTIAAHLNISSDELKEKYLESGNFDIWNTIHTPCDFLSECGECILGEHKPDGCAQFPYTNKPERLESLYSILTAVEICPVAFEILERLKQEYGFR